MEKKQISKLIDELMSSDVEENQIFGSALLLSDDLTFEERKERVRKWLEDNFSNDGKKDPNIEVMANIIKANILIQEKTIDKRIEKL